MGSTSTFSSAHDLVKRGNLDLSDDELIASAFEVIEDQVSRMQCGERARLLEVLKPLPEQASLAFLLGEIVDQRVRPPITAKSLFTLVVDPDWHKFSHQYPELRKPIDPLSAEPGKVVRVTGPKRPIKRVLRKQPRLPGELAPPDDWFATMSALFEKIGMARGPIRILEQWASRVSDPDTVVRRRQLAVRKLAEVCTEGFETLSLGVGQISVAVDESDPPTDGKKAPAGGGDSKPKGKSRGMRVQEANEKAMALAKKMGRKFFSLSEREQARAIGCHWKTWTSTPFFKTLRLKQPKSKPETLPSRKTISLTPKLESLTGKGKRDEVLYQLIADEAKDTEPSPPVEDPP